MCVFVHILQELFWWPFVQGYRLFMLKNPWNHLRWKGNFSETDQTHWTPDLQKALNFDPLSAQMVDNGKAFTAQNPARGWIEIQYVYQLAIAMKTFTFAVANCIEKVKLRENITFLLFCYMQYLYYSCCLWKYILLLFLSYYNHLWVLRYTWGCVYCGCACLNAWFHMFCLHVCVEQEKNKRMKQFVNHLQQL